MRERNGRAEEARELRGVDDVALEALLAVAGVWERRHRGFRWRLDRWGEGPSRVTLADLGLDARLRTVTLMGVCSRHGKFFLQWTGRYEDEAPHAARCSLVDGAGICDISSRLYQLPPDAQAA